MINPIYIDNLIKTALLEDINYLDTTTDYLIDENSVDTAQLVSKSSGVLCGIDIALQVFRTLQPDIIIKKNNNDGVSVKKGDILAEITGKTRAILKAERTALNILQHMSAISTATAKAVETVKGTSASITDTRKTLPGLRPLQKYAVSVGGGKNHRFNLSDAAMLKDNHIDASGGIINAVGMLREQIGHMVNIEVEVRSLDELEQALSVKCDIIMLDNMSCEQMREAVLMTNGRALLEASGGITQENLREVAQTGVDIISLGALTHSVKAFDISLKIV